MFLIVQFKIMMLLSLLTGVLLGALSAQAEVVQSFRDCNEFFYNNKEPTGMDQNTKKICQRYRHYPKPFFATLYSEYHRIPLYSAYIFNGGTVSARARKAQWFIEPQISGFNNYEMMSSESEFNISVMKVNQSINDDYKDTGYDRGHLNPYSFQVGDGRVATFTLTNAAPMDACFNRVQWKEWESELRDIIQQNLRADRNKATAYLVTGTVPTPSYRIPKKGEFDEDEVRDLDRVTVPTHVWMALCYKHLNEDQKSFSLAYVGENQPESNIRVMSVREVNSILGDQFPQAVQIFDDDCFPDNQRSQKAANKLYKQIQLSVSRRLQIPPDVLDSFQKQPSSTDLQPHHHPTKRTKGKNMIIMRSFDNASSFFKELENLKYVTESTCLLTKVTSSDVECQQVLENSEIGSKTAADGTHCKNPVSPVYCVCESGSKHGKCLVVPEILIAEEMTTANYWSGLRCCDTESGLIPYCTSPCLYLGVQKGYQCYSGDTYIQCSPQYSLITAKGEKCKDDHPCATYGRDHYWCEKASGSTDYCSPPLPDSITTTGKKCRINHACSNYGKSYYWCYTDYNDHWEYCCTHNDRFSAVNGKTCKPDHPCGKYGKGYLWCYTTDGNWEKCCVGD
ncbi:endonuclease domain-containing 1 protein-like isoform X4 [Brienomyrus brachyistius]|uniref:endonuclease domain-containing 1 protein-like isoform X4 n=1 Tax=Brienomyrus brachyistius TaxID=42636 RepID=UPI0020B1A3AE|nr:endonuclease domain-containing 1 protein-like isoform X4 [Brienomyrus brachyistius]